MDHTHPYLEIFTCAEGELRVHGPDGILTVPSGEAAIIPPGIPHHKLPENDPAVFQCISFFIRKHPAAECQDLYSLLEPFCRSDRILVFPCTPELFSIMNELNEKYNSSQRMIPELHFLYLLSRISDENKFGYQAEKCIGATPDSSLIRMNLLDRFIGTEFTHHLNAADIAQQLHISERQLARLVKQRYNKTLYQMITEKRLNAAAEMLLTSDVSAGKIAAMVGFTSKNVFWREFKRKFGKSPAQYRNEKT